jgi:putative ABC transport system permease protein
MIEYIIRLKRKQKSLLQDGWVWRMAWRDARHNLARLALFTASLMAGIAAVVALDSINQSLQEDIDRNAKELLGADLVVNANKAFEPDVLAMFDSTKLPQASEADMASMVLFLHNQQSRLIRLVGLEGDFPFYGKLVAQPEDAYARMKGGSFAMLDQSLASQYEVSTGDSLRIGKSTFVVSGVVTQLPGGGGILSTFTPSVYIARRDLDSTGLVQFGSRISYKQYFKTATDEEADKLAESMRPRLRQQGYGYDTVEERKREMGEAFASVYRFFSLLAFVALILGCIGVASSVHIYAREKRDEVAILRCLGSTGWQAFNIYFIQILILGVIGSIAGALAGLGIQQIIPLLAGDLLPREVSFGVSWVSVGRGVLLGTLVSVLFSMLPLTSVRFVPPLTVLRADFQSGRIFSKLKVVAIVLIALFPMLFAAYLTRSWLSGILFFVGLALALGLLALVAIGLLFAVKKLFPENASFAWRHSLANLFRPNNQTHMLMVAIGLGAFIIATLNIVEKSMLGQVEFTGRENQSNTILFDIQPYQRDGVVALMKEKKLPVNQLVPIITCRLSEVRGKSIESLQQDTTDKIPNWALTREYRVTYRDSLHVSEEMLKGKLQHKEAGQDSVWVTISEGMQESLEVSEGDSLVFDVQGVPVKARISGIRKVEWSKDPPNFIFVFPSGVLEQAPQVYVAATRVDDPVQANSFQQQLVMQFPNVSLIDLRLILSTINTLFDKLGLIVRFLALFSVITGLVVLAGAVINSKYVRMKENVLLRTLGASKKHIRAITLIEYGYLGLFSSLTGMALSLGGGWLLTTYFFEIAFSVDWLELLIVTASVVVLTMSIGWWNSRAIINTPPLQILRKET